MVKYFVFPGALLLCSLFSKSQSIDMLPPDSIQNSTRFEMEMIQGNGDQSHMQKSSSDLTYLADSGLKYSWDKTGNKWNSNPYSQTKYEYDDAGRFTNIGIFTWNSVQNTWIPQSDTHRKYNTSGDPVEYFIKEYDTIAKEWVPLEQDTFVYNNSNVLTAQTNLYFNKINKTWFVGKNYAYNDAGKIVETFYKQWDSKSFTRMRGTRSVYILNKMNLADETINQQWDTISNSWINSGQILAHYIDDTILDNETINAWSGGSSWTLSGQNLYTYTSGLLTEKIKQVWDMGSLAWINSEKEDYSYNSNGFLVERLFLYWFGSEWSIPLRYVYTYDLFNHITSLSIERWYTDAWVFSSVNSYSFDDIGRRKGYSVQTFDPLTGLVYDGYSYEFNYDSDNLANNAVYKRWNRSTNDWENSYTEHLYYSSHNITLLNQVNDGIIHAFPNPAINELHISRVQPGCSITVYDLKGHKLISSIAKSTNESILVSSLSPGIYILRVSEGKKTMTTKFVKQ